MKGCDRSLVRYLHVLVSWTSCFSRPEICCGDRLQRELLRHAPSSALLQRQTTRLWARRRSWHADQPGLHDRPDCRRCADLRLTVDGAVRGLGDLLDRTGPLQCHGKSLRVPRTLRAARALRRGAGPILPCSTTIRSTPVLFFLSSAREMAAALCPFFHRSHSSAFCAAVNQIRDVTMAHLLTS